MKANGVIEIEWDRPLNNPTLKIKKISYDQLNNDVIVECQFNEEGGLYPHIKNYTFFNEDGRQLNYNDIVLMINNHDDLKVFK